MGLTLTTFSFHFFFAGMFCWIDNCKMIFFACYQTRNHILEINCSTKYDINDLKQWWWSNEEELYRRISTQLIHLGQIIWWLSHLPFFAIRTNYVSQFSKFYIFCTFHFQIFIRFSLFRFSNYIRRSNWIKLRVIKKFEPNTIQLARKWNNEWKESLASSVKNVKQFSDNRHWLAVG